MSDKKELTIEEQAVWKAEGMIPEHHNNSHISREYYESGFIAGANYQRYLTRWRKVEDEMPEVSDIGTSAPVLVKTKYGSYDVAVYNKIYDDFISLPNAIAGVTHWMPIPK